MPKVVPVTHSRSIGERALLWMLPKIGFKLDELKFVFSAPPVAQSVVLKVSNVALGFDAIVVKKQRFTPTISISSIGLGISVARKEEELLGISSITLSVPLEVTDGLVLPQSSGLIDFGIEKVSSNCLLASLFSVQSLIVAALERLPKRDEHQTEKKAVSKPLPLWVTKLEVPKLRIRLPLIAVRVKSRSHTLQLDSDAVCNASVSTKGGPIVVTAEISINVAVDACPIGFTSVVNPLARLSGLHCFVQLSSSEKMKAFDLKVECRTFFFFFFFLTGQKDHDDRNSLSRCS